MSGNFPSTVDDEWGCASSGGVDVRRETEYWIAEAKKAAAVKAAKELLGRCVMLSPNVDDKAKLHQPNGAIAVPQPRQVNNSFMNYV